MQFKSSFSYVRDFKRYFISSEGEKQYGYMTKKCVERRKMTKYKEMFKLTFLGRGGVKFLCNHRRESLLLKKREEDEPWGKRLRQCYHYA